MNDYHLRDEIGRGNGSIVYKGRRRKTISFYAISSIEKTKRERVLRSVNTLRALARHRNMLQFHNWYETSNHLWVITELCTGGDVRTILTQDKRFSESSVRLFAADMLSGLFFIHSRGYVYRDLKPSNLLMDSTGSIRFYDFGLCYKFEESASCPLVGTPMYMAPELFMAGKGVGSMASDLWSLGVVLYHMLAGEPPFTGKTLAAYLHTLFTSPLPRISGVSDEMNSLLARLLEKNPLRRATWREIVSNPIWEDSVIRKELNVAELPTSEPAWEASRKHFADPWTEVEVREVINSAVACARSNVAMSVQASDELGGALNDLMAEADFTPSARTTERSGGYSEGGAKNVTKIRDVVNNSGPSADCGATPSNHRADNNISPTHRPSNANTAAVAAPAYQGNDVISGKHLESLTMDGATVSGMNISEYVWHTSDTNVRPIFGNVRIERYVEPTFDEGALPVAALSISGLKALSEKEMGSFIKSIYMSLSSDSTSVKRRENTLHYLELIGKDSAVSNMLVNSSLMTVFVDMVANRSLPGPLRTAAASVTALLIRFTTYIGSELFRADIVPRLFSLFETEHELRVKQKLITCIGELVFYVYVQKESERQQCGVTPTDIQRILLLAMETNDDYIKHCAVKALENLSTHADIGIIVCTQRIVSGLLAVWAQPTSPKSSSSRIAYMKSSALCAAIRLAIIKEELLPIVFSSSNLPRNSYASVIKSLQLPRTGQVMLTLLNVALLKCMASTENPYAAVWAKSALPGEPASLLSSTLRKGEAEDILNIIVGLASDILDAVSDVVEKISPSLQGKSLLFVLLLSCLGGTVLSKVVTSAHIAYLDRVMREEDKYIRQCSSALCIYLSIYFSEKLSVISQRVSSNTTPLYLASIQQLLSSVSIRRQVMIKDDVFISIADCMEKALNSSMYQTYEENFNGLCDRMIQSPDFIVTYCEPICLSLVKPFVAMLQQRDGKRRFTAIRFLMSLMVPLTGEKRYRHSEVLGRAVLASITAANAVLPDLLMESSPIPAHTMRLLATCAEWNPTSFTPILSIGLLTHVMEYLTTSSDTDKYYALMLLYTLLSSQGKEEYTFFVIRQKLPNVVMKSLALSLDQNMEDLMEVSCELADYLLKAVENCPTSREALQCLCFAEDGAIEKVLLPLCQLQGAPDGGSAAVCDSAARIVHSGVRLSSAAQQSVLSWPALSAACTIFAQAKFKPAVADQLLKAILYACESQRRQDLHHVREHEQFISALQSLTANNAMARTAQRLIGVLM